MSPLATIGCAALAVMLYGWFEAGWLRKRVMDVPIDGLPYSLDGLRIGHLSDFHLGVPLSRGDRATGRAVEWVSARQPDLVCITGDLVSRPRGEARLRELLERLDRPFVVLGNHDVAVTRDPFSRAGELHDLGRARLLRDETVAIVVRGETISIVGIDPGMYRSARPRPYEPAHADGSFRLLLCHFPAIVDRMPEGSSDLILAGHLHAGQICLPWPGRRIALAHVRARFLAGLYATNAGTMHVSPGTGTTFLPFRLFARPEVTELVLRRRA
jgi:predicted MPP superfamily phosphohydrolase